MANKNRRIFLKEAGAAIAISSFPFQSSNFFENHIIQDEPEVYFTNGFKIAEVNTNSAIFWTRLCADKSPKPITHNRKDEVFRHPIDFNEDGIVSEMDGAVAGQNGKARLTVKGNNFKKISDWHTCDTVGDHTVKIELSNLKPNTKYQVIWEAKKSNKGTVTKTEGSFTTAPESHTSKDLKLVTSTCQYFWSHDDKIRGFQSYDAMNKLKPDFFIHTGDYIYYDKPGPLAKNLEKARHKWHAMNGWPALRDLFANTPIYMLKDDHDLLKDDVDPTREPYGELTFSDGLKIWSENAPLHDLPYRTIRWGKHLQIWMLEGREYRSANKLEDSDEKTILGKKQKQWLTETVSASDATFKLLFSPTPIVGPDRPKKTDNHANKTFETEGVWLRNFIANQKNMYVVNGDRHWQYVSVDPKTKIIEFGSGPVSDNHAQGWEADDIRPEHRFLRLKGGFLSIDVKSNEKATIKFTHHDVTGNPVHSEIFEV